MDFIKKIFSSKKHELSEDEHEKFQSMISNHSAKSSFNITEYIHSLSTLEEINRIRNLLDKREQEIEQGNLFLIDADLKTKHIPEFLSDEKEDSDPYFQDLGDEPVSQIEEEFKNEEVKEIEPTQDIPIPEKIENDDFFKQENEEDNKDILDTHSEIDSLLKDIEEDEKKEENIINENPESYDIIETYPNSEEINLSSFDSETGLFKNSLIDIFGSENVLSTVQKHLPIDGLRDKKIFHIGIRNKHFFNSGKSLSEENSWFISKIKQLPELKQFKVIRSEQGSKDLVWIKEDYAILISFRATTFLKSLEEFDFNL
jgi:hypothetical protein